MKLDFTADDLRKVRFNPRAGPARALFDQVSLLVPDKPSWASTASYGHESSPTLELVERVRTFGVLRGLELPLRGFVGMSPQAV